MKKLYLSMAAALAFGCTDRETPDVIREISLATCSSSIVQLVVADSDSGNSEVIVVDFRERQYSPEEPPLTGEDAEVAVSLFSYDRTDRAIDKIELRRQGKTYVAFQEHDKMGMQYERMRVKIRPYDRDVCPVFNNSALSFKQRDLNLRQITPQENILREQLKKSDDDVRKYRDSLNMDKDKPLDSSFPVRTSSEREDFSEEEILRDRIKESAAERENCRLLLAFKKEVLQVKILESFSGMLTDSKSFNRQNASQHDWRRWISKFRHLRGTGVIHIAKNIQKAVSKEMRWANDSIVYRKIDYWAPPAESERRRKGDCEDYALLNAATLMDLGVESWRLSLCLVKCTHSPEILADHAVLRVNAGSREKPAYCFMDNNAAAKLLFPADVEEEYIRFFSVISLEGKARAAMVPRIRIGK